jgi:hypothetical protein
MELLDSLYSLAGMVSAVIVMVCAILSLRRAQSNKHNSLFFYLLAGAFACALLSDAYYALTTFLLDYPYIISPGDLSWAGAIVFLITAALYLIDKWTPEQRQIAQKYRLPALAAPVICVAFNVVYIAIYPEIIANYLLYGIPTTILSYFALWLLLAGWQADVQPALRWYHLMVLVWLAAQLFHDLFSTFGGYYGFLLHMTVFAWLIALLTPALYIAAQKGMSE